MGLDEILSTEINEREVESVKQDQTVCTNVQADLALHSPQLESMVANSSIWVKKTVIVFFLMNNDSSD